MAKPQKKAQKKKAVTAPRPGSSQVRKVEQLLQEESLVEAANLALESSDRYPDNPDFPELAVRALLGMDQRRRALLPLQRLLLLEPDRASALHLGAVTYAANDMYAHAVRCFRRMQELNPDPDTMERLKGVIEKGDEILKAAAEKLGVSFEEAEEGSFWQEDGNIRRYGGDLSGAQESLRQAVDALSQAVIPRLLLSEAEFLTGRLDEAEASCRKALEIDPSEVEAWLRLIMIARARYDDAAMQAAYSELTALPLPESFAARAALAKAHGLMGEHDRAYEVARKISEEERSVHSTTLPVLAAAAANTGHTREAIGYYRLLQPPSEPPSLELTALEIGHPGPTIAPTFPYIGIAELIDLQRFREIVPLLMPDEDAYHKATPEDRRAFLERYPQLLWVGEKFLFEEDLDVGLGILLSLGSDRAVSIVRHLLESPDTPWSARIKAATALKDHGHWKDGEILALRFEDRRMEVTPDQIEAVFNGPELPEGAVEGVIESIEAQMTNPKRSERILRQLLEKYPDVPMLYHNLSLLVDRDEAETLLRRAIEVHPEYVYARSTLAVLLATGKNVDEAREILSEIPPDRLLNPSEYSALHYAEAHLHRARGRMDEAIEQLQKLLREDPEHPSARRLLQQVRDAKKKGLLLLDEQGYWMNEDPLAGGNPLAHIRRG
ncbi:MAG: tetratricopeptide repeat protein [Armatimonadetes bacterium]|nr:tetratricopeptide repeat protein [Armatimonadota bacterium]